MVLLGLGWGLQGFWDLWGHLGFSLSWPGVFGSHWVSEVVLWARLGSLVLLGYLSGPDQDAGPLRTLCGWVCGLWGLWV